MKVLIAFLLFSTLLFSCNDHDEEPMPTATGTYSGTYSGYVSPSVVSGTCKADLAEKDSKISGTVVFSPNIFFSGFPGTSSSFPILGNLKLEGDTVYTVSGTISIGSGIGDVPFGGRVSKDKKKIEMFCNPAPVFNLKWNLTKD
jgi:hypothetical protein